MTAYNCRRIPHVFLGFSVILYNFVMLGLIGGFFEFILPKPVGMGDFCLKID